MPTPEQYSHYSEHLREIAEHASTIHAIIWANMDMFRGTPIEAIMNAHKREFMASTNLIQEILNDWQAMSGSQHTERCP